MNDASEVLETAMSELATANHILYDQGVLDGFGHVSVRHPARSDLFLLSRNCAPALVQVNDILTLDLDGEIIDGAHERSYLERFIHSEIYRVRPDVMGIVHSHSPSVLPYTVVSGASLCPVCHMSGFLHPAAPVYEIRDHAGEASDMLIRNAELGASLAGELGDRAVVLMRGHGLTVVGGSLKQAVFRAIYTEVNARIQAAGSLMGPMVGLNAEESRLSDAVNTAQMDRAWNFWRRRASVNAVISGASFDDVDWE